MMYLRPVGHRLHKAVRNSTRCISINTCKLSTNPGNNSTSNLDNVKPEGWEKALPYKSIPGPKPLPLIGNAWLFLPFIGKYNKTSLSDLQKTLYDKYGKIFCLGSLPAADMVFVSDPNDIETVYRNEGIYPERDIASKTIGYYRQNVRNDIFQGVIGTLPVQGKEWHDFRSKVNPILMQPNNMLQYIEGIDSVADALLTKIRHFAKLNPNREMPDDFLLTIYSWALESVAFIALDKRLGCLNLNLDDNSESLKIIKNVVLMLELYEKLELQPSIGNIYKTKTWKRFVEVVDYTLFTFLKYIKEAESQIKEQGEKSNSVLQQLLKIDKKVATAMSVDMLSAGVDTTGKQTASILYYLAKNQGVQDILRKELKTLLPNKESPISKEVLGQASYLKAVIKETERLAPIAAGNLRHAGKDMVLSGYQIPKGTRVVLCGSTASKLEENYPRPLEFLPERWLRTTTGELSHKNTNPFVTLPFGFGPRSCIGKRIANLEMEIGVAKIIRNFCVMWHHGEAKFHGAPFVGIVNPLRFQFNEVEN